MQRRRSPAGDRAADWAKVARRLSDQIGNERRHALGVAGVGLAELPAHDSLLDRKLAPERGASEDDGERAPPLPDRQSGSDEGDENAGVDWMADESVGTGDDELMVALKRDVGAPVVGDPHPRPNGESDARKGQRRADLHQP